MKNIAILAFLAFPGCSSVYVPAQVTESGAGLNVSVVEMTADSVVTANTETPYSPHILPREFNTTAGAGSGIRGLGALPESPARPEPRPPVPALIPPPTEERGPYTIGTGDVLVLATLVGGQNVEELIGLSAAQSRRQAYTVQDDGSITIPDIGRIPVGGLTLAQAEEAIFSEFVVQQIDPSFSIEIAEFNSQRASIGGAVKSATVVPIQLGPVYLNEVIAAAGGLTVSDSEFATIRIYRSGALYQIPLTEYLSSSQWQRIHVIDGDSIFVDTEFSLEKAQAYFEQEIRLSELRRSTRAAALAELQTEIEIRRSQLNEQRGNFQTQLELEAIDRDYVYLTGEVGTPKRYPLPFNSQLSLADALFEAGGIAESTGNPSHIYVIRQRPSDVVAYQLDGSNVVNLVLATRFELRPSDIVFVAEQPVTRWNRVVQQIVPSLIVAGTNAALN